MEEVLIDYLHERGVQVEWCSRAESLEMHQDEFPVAVHISHGQGDRQTSIKARYMVACDGAHSWTRGQLHVPMDASSEESTWGVLDVIPITDFRKPCHPQKQATTDDISRHPPILYHPRFFQRQHHATSPREPSRSILYSAERRRGAREVYDATYTRRRHPEATIALCPTNI